MAISTIISDEATHKAYVKELGVREMGAITLLGKVAEVQRDMYNLADAYNTIVRKVELNESDEKKLASLEVQMEDLNADSLLYARSAHYASILKRVAKEDDEGNKTYDGAIVEAVISPYYGFKKIAARMDNKAGAKLAKITDGKGLVSLTELQSFARANIGVTPDWTTKAAALQRLLTAKVAVDLETGLEIGLTSQTADSLNLYRAVRADSTLVSNTKLTNALKEVVSACLPKEKCASAAHIADVRYLVAAMTGSTKKLGEVRVSTGGTFNDLLISVFARIVGVTKGYSILA